MTIGSTRRQLKALVLLIVLVVLASPAKALIDADGICIVYTFVPFTTNFGTEDAGGFIGDNRTNYGFSQMAAALLAADHFNARNSTFVPELAELGGCNIQLNLSSFFDTGSLTSMASERLIQQLLQGNDGPPCAIAGPYNDYPALELSVVAQAIETPIVVHRAYNPRVDSLFHNRFTTQVYPDLVSSTRSLVSFLLNKGRTNYVALLYSLSDVNFSRRESLIFHLDKNSIKWVTSTYTLADGALASNFRRPLAALQQIKKSGFRTVVVAMDNAIAELPEIADAAEALGMNDGRYFWVWFDVVDVMDLTENITKLLEGSAWITPLVDDTEDVGYVNQSQAEVDRLNQLNPISEGQPGYRFANDDFFQTVEPEFGSGFMYDAIMCIGIGACLSQRSPDNGTVSGMDHLGGIRSVDFVGRTGHILFGEDEDTDSVGARRSSTVNWAAINLFPPGTGEFAHLSDILLEEFYGNKWMQVEEDKPFIYRDGRTVPPDLLIDEPEQNYLNDGLRIFGLSCMAFVMFAAALSALWVFVCRKHRVVKASQPAFLYLICFGAMVQASAVLTLSFDESQGKSEDQLNKACMATPWLLSLGHIIIYASLFTKMWRVHKVLQFSRHRTNLKQLVIPMAVLVLCDLVLLTLWTVLDPIVWVRSEINSVTGESIGECEGDHAIAFWCVLVVLLVIPMIATGYFAYKTKDVDETYTESKWVFILIVWQVELMLIGVPIAVLLRDSSTDGRYMGYAFIFLTFPISTIGFIILPKFLAYRRDVRGVLDRPKRGERVHGRVTGIAVPNRPGGNRTTVVTTTTSTSLKSGIDDVSRNSGNEELHNDLSTIVETMREETIRDGVVDNKETNCSTVEANNV